jgi:hypothetical protein
VSRTSAPTGPHPSAPPAILCKLVSLPRASSLNTVPQVFAFGPDWVVPYMFPAASRVTETGTVPSEPPRKACKKIVQRATVEVLNAIYETDFLGFSYGFRPGRSQHNALDALYAGLLTKKVNGVLDLDIRGYFDALSHEWLVKFVEHRIADRRVVRLIPVTPQSSWRNNSKWRMVYQRGSIGGPLTSSSTEITLV